MSDEHLELIKTEIRKERRWHLKSINIADYHRIQCEKYEDVRNKKWTILDSANELHLSCGYISESLKLARAYSEGLISSEMTREKALGRLRGEKFI